MIPRSRNELVTAVGWAVETESDPSMATADWLAQDAFPRAHGIFALVNDPEIPVEVLVQLKDMSEVAYIRFASVYRQFRGIDDFVSTLETMNTDSKGHLAAVG